MGCGCVIVICRLTMLRNATSSRTGDLTRSSYVHFCDSDQQSVHRFSQECFQQRPQGFQRVTMPRLCRPILSRTGKHTLLRHYLRVSTFHRSIVIDLYAGNPSQHRQRQGRESKISGMAACVSEIGYNASPWQEASYVLQRSTANLCRCGRLQVLRGLRRAAAMAGPFGARGIVRSFARR